MAWKCLGTARPDWLEHSITEPISADGMSERVRTASFGMALDPWRAKDTPNNATGCSRLVAPLSRILCGACPTPRKPKPKSGVISGPLGWTGAFSSKVFTRTYMKVVSPQTPEEKQQETLFYDWVHYCLGRHSRPAAQELPCLGFLRRRLPVPVEYSIVNLQRWNFHVLGSSAAGCRFQWNTL